MEDKYDPTEDDINRLFDKFDKANKILDDAGEIIESTRIQVEEQLAKKVTDITKRVIEDLDKEYSELGIFQKYHFILGAIVNLSVTQSIHSIVIKSLSEGARESDEYKDALERNVENEFEKELRGLVYIATGLNPNKNKK